MILAEGWSIEQGDWSSASGLVSKSFSLKCHWADVAIPDLWPVMNGNSNILFVQCILIIHVGLSLFRKQLLKCWFTFTEGTTSQLINVSEKVTGMSYRGLSFLSPAGNTRMYPLTWPHVHGVTLKLSVITWSAAWSPTVCPATVEAKIALPWRRYCRATTSRTRTRSTVCATRLYWSTWTTTWVLLTHSYSICGSYVQYLCVSYLANSISVF